MSIESTPSAPRPGYDDAERHRAWSYVRELTLKAVGCPVLVDGVEYRAIDQYVWMGPNGAVTLWRLLGSCSHIQQITTQLIAWAEYCAGEEKYSWRDILYLPDDQWTPTQLETIKRWRERLQDRMKREDAEIAAAASRQSKRQQQPPAATAGTPADSWSTMGQILDGMWKPSGEGSGCSSNARRGKPPPSSPPQDVPF
jgi:hypothetical protein